LKEGFSDDKVTVNITSQVKLSTETYTSSSSSSSSTSKRFLTGTSSSTTTRVMLFEISVSAKVPVIKGESTEYSATALFKADIGKLKQMNENGSSVLADNIQKQMSSLNVCELFMEFGDEADEVSFVENSLNVTSYDVESVTPNEGKKTVVISPTPFPTTLSPSPQPTLLQSTISVASVTIVLLAVTTCALLGENDVLDYLMIMLSCCFHFKLLSPQLP
jgi:hypothetical protein